MSAEQLVEGMTYGVALALLVLAAIWYGFELRSRLARKLEHFHVGQAEWHAYDDREKVREQERGQVFGFKERQSER